MKSKIFVLIIAALIVATSLYAPAVKIAEMLGLLELPKLGNIIEEEESYGGDSLLMSLIQTARADIIDTYTNYLPAYAQIVTFTRTKQADFNAPWNTLLSDIAAKAIAAERATAAAETSGTDVLAAPDTTTGEPAVPVVADTSAPATETSAPAADTTSPATETNAPAADTTAPATDTTAPATDTTAPAADTTAPAPDTTAPAADTTAPAPDTTAPAEQKPYIVSHKSTFLRSSNEGINFYSIEAEWSDGSETGLLTTAFNTGVKTYTKRMRETAEQINAIAAANTDVNVYFYLCSRFQDCEAFESVIPGEVSTKPQLDEFFTLLDPRIRTDRLKVDSLEDSIEKLFLTDHHWNAYGMYEAYTDIVNMIRADSPSIAEPRAIGERYDIEDADFYGTFARTCGYYTYCDDFFFYDYDLPEHELISDKPYSFKSVMKNYLKGRFSKDISADHYVNFYPYTQYLAYPENKTGRVLLLLGDSYSRGISELLGSSFDEAYIFDYRRIAKIGDYNKFIEENGVTDVLFMQYSLRGVFDNQNDNTLDKIKLK